MAVTPHEVVFDEGRWDGRTVAEWVPDVVSAIAERLDPLRIVLFGSVARGEAGPHSDIDLLVVLPRVEHRIESAIAIRRAIADLPPPIDLVPTDPDEVERRRGHMWSLVGAALDEGKVVYERAA